MEASVAKRENVEARVRPSRFALSPLNQRRLANFKANRRGYWSLWIFLVLFGLSLVAELLANDRPIVVQFKGEFYFPVAVNYPEETFLGDEGFLPVTDYKIAEIQQALDENGWALWPPVRYSYRTVNTEIPEPAPAKPSWLYDEQTRCANYPLGVDDPACTIGNWNWLGTDDQARDVLARVIYGFRVSVLFGLILTAASALVGVTAGAVQGYFGGWVDLIFQRFIEIWSSMPVLYILLIMAAVLPPGFWVLLLIMLLFQWVAFVGIVRAEFLRARNFEYVNAARALGVGDLVDHVPPSAAQRDGLHADLPAVHPQRFDHHADLARFPRAWPAAGIGFAGRADEPGPQQPAGALARPLRLRGDLADALAADLRRRGNARCLRSAQDFQVSAGMKSGPMTKPDANAGDAPLLSVRDLSVAFTQGGRTTLAVDKVSFDIAKGETLALVGESGSGKSVSALSILKLLPYPPASHPSGEIFFKGENLLDNDDSDLRRVRGNDITMIFQEPMTSLNPLHSIERQIGEILEIHRGLSGAAQRKRILELLDQVGMRDAESRLGAYPHQLSGGQRQRVMIAMALANDPELLIADEPTTALDVTVQAQILELLAKLQRERGMAMLFITHDLGIVRKISDRVCVMQAGKVVEHGPTAEIFANPQHEYTRHLLAAEPKGKPPLADLSAPVVMEGDDVKVWFPIKRGLMRKVVGHVKAVDGIDVVVREGQTLGIVGESGSGKTTLGLALTRLISSQGRINFAGKQIDSYTFRQMRPLRNEIQIVFQDPFGSLSPRMSVGEIVAEGLAVHEPQLDAQTSATTACARRWAKSGSTRRRASAIRTNFPAASASASRSRAPSC